MPNRNSSDEHTLSVASLFRKAVAIGFGSSVIIGRYPTDEDTAASLPHDSVCVDDGQVVRAVAFLQIPDGPLCVVSAGDSKCINVYDISSWKEDDTITPQNVSMEDNGQHRAGNGGPHNSGAPRETSNCETLTAGHLGGALKAGFRERSYQYGPHTKRITSLATGTEGTIVFADKFGEVYRLRLRCSPSHTIEVDGDAAKPETFLLQHFSIISCLYLSAPVPRMEAVAASEDRRDVLCRRLFTCDKDRHARVSRYPEAHVVEQFLWTRRSTQSVVTCITEIDQMGSDAASAAPLHHSASRTDLHSKAHDAPYSYYVTGTYTGDVHFWAAKNTVPMDSDEETFHLINTFCPQGAAGVTEDCGAVVGVALLASIMDRVGNKRHPRDCPRGILIAYERCSDLFFVPIYDNMGTYGVLPALASATRASLNARPAALVGSNYATAFVLKRNGSVSFVRLCEVAQSATAVPDRLCSFNANICVTVQELPLKMPGMEAHIKALMCTPSTADGAAASATELETLDLSAAWRHAAVDPRTRRQGNADDDDNDSDESAEDGENGSPSHPKKKESNNIKKKRARLEA